MICPNCGNKFNIIGTKCPYCQEDLTINNINKNHKRRTVIDSDSSSTFYFIISAIIPFFGLIYYIRNCTYYPNKSYNTLRGFKYNCVFLVLVILIIILFKK